MNYLIRKIGSSVIFKATPLKNNVSHINKFLPIETSRCYAYHYPGEKQYDPNQSIDYEVSKNHEEWKYVTRLLPSKWINAPKPQDSYPSGWKPPDPSALSQPYYVCRTKNYMIPVYLKITFRGQRKTTIIRYIRGDIWLFYEDLKKYLEDKVGKEIGIRVDEVAGKIILKGDHVYYTTEWLKERGF